MGFWAELCRLRVQGEALEVGGLGLRLQGFGFELKGNLGGYSWDFGAEALGS